MTTGKRIKKLRKTLDLTQQKFAERIGIKGNTVAQYELERSNPVDSVISLICREFNVNEEWLRTGDGEMFLDFTEDEFARAAMSLSNDVFVRSLIMEYWKLDYDSKKLFLDFVHRLSKNIIELSNSVSTDFNEKD